MVGFRLTNGTRSPAGSWPGSIRTAFASGIVSARKRSGPADLRVSGVVEFEPWSSAIESVVAITRLPSSSQTTGYRAGFAFGAVFASRVAVSSN